VCAKRMPTRAFLTARPQWMRIPPRKVVFVRFSRCVRPRIEALVLGLLVERSIKTDLCETSYRLSNTQ